MVENELTFSYKDLIDRKLTEDWVTLCCVSNEVGGDLIGNACWSGVLIRELLAEAGVKAGADAVLQTSRDGWNCGTPLSALTDPDRNAMLAVAMNGKPLPVEHGFPVRMVVPGLYGYVSATKWVVDLEVTALRQVRGVLDPAGLVGEGTGEDPVAHRRTRQRRQREGRLAAHRRQRVGAAHRHREGRVPARRRRLGRGRARSRAGRRHLGAVVGHGRRRARRAPRWWCGRPTSRATRRPRSRTDVVPDGATGWDSVPFDAT